jgi:hypothetical protein
LTDGPTATSPWPRIKTTVAGVGGVTRTDVAKTVQHAEIGEHAAANHHVLKQGGVDA